MAPRLSSVLRNPGRDDQLGTRTLGFWQAWIPVSNGGSGDHPVPAARSCWTGSRSCSATERGHGPRRPRRPLHRGLPDPALDPPERHLMTATPAGPQGLGPGTTSPCVSSAPCTPSFDLRTVAGTYMSSCPRGTPRGSPGPAWGEIARQISEYEHPRQDTAAGPQSRRRQVARRGSATPRFGLCRWSVRVLGPAAGRRRSRGAGR